MQGSRMPQLETRKSQESTRREQSSGIDAKRRRLTPYYLICLAYVASIPFENAITLAGRSFSWFLAPAVVLGYLLTQRSRRGIVYTRSWAGKWVAGLMVASVALSALTLLWSLSPEVGLDKLVTIVGLLCVALVLALEFADGSSAPIWTYVGASSISALAAIRQSGAASGDRIATFNLNENQASFFYVVAVAGVLYLLPRTHRTGRRLFLFGLLVVFVVAVLLTGSRTGALGLLTIPVAIGLGAAGRGSPAQRIGALMAAGLTAVIAWFVIQSKPVFVPERVWSVFDKLNAQDTDRFLFWQLAWDDRSSWILFGHGLGSQIAYMTASFDIFQVLHNTYATVLVEGGLLVAVPYFAMLLLAGLAAAHSPYRPFLLLAGMPAFLFTLTGSLEYNKLLWLLLALAIAPNIKKRPRLNKNDVGSTSTLASRRGQSTPPHRTAYATGLQERR